MKPYFDDGRVQIWHGDCRDVLPTLTAGSVDLVITSPPYNVGISPGGNGRGFYTQSRGGRAMTKWKGFDGYGAHDDAMPMDEYREWQRSTLTQLWSVLSDRGAIYYNHKPRIVFKELWTPLELNPGLPLRQIITWSDGPGFALGDGHYCPSCEWVMLFAKSKFRLPDRSASAIGDFWRIPSESDKHGHPCPYPIGLPLRILQTNVAGVVLDPFLGVGTTLVAAKLLGLPAIGIELDERWCEMAVKRISEVLPMRSAEDETAEIARTQMTFAIQ